MNDYLPLYCKKCGYTIPNPEDKDYRWVDGQQRFPYCPNCPDQVMFHKVLGAKGDYEHISDSLAISPSQIAEHKEQFPNVDVMPDGRVRFTSVKQQSDYCKKTGFEKVPQKIKGKSTRIA